MADAERGVNEMLAVRASVVAELLDSPEWKHKFEKAKSLQEIQKVLEDFCKAKGYKITSSR